ncbi:anthranilate phosphoribosyltransferase [Anoxybacillus tengchongensis]|uniref:Anthranilate phosphoribosyltransferase n=1 Tax=Anoxybacillus tengchongensis TaxID=576944 RepID=A0A7W9YP06_9BACL|nr:anthranilate phosphoribosyltransferase [Anoxybacillus tengchongensis]MBB6175545.1 anthranilate phosphoribosyltransferase [Anoxybacillus tengchongensis]
MFERFLHKCAGQQTLTEQEAYEAMHAMMSGEVDERQVAAFLVLLRFRGETVDELVGFIRAMRERMRTVSFDEPVIDTCGTGGDGKGTFNISTAVALLVASLDVAVAKHGNRAVSSTSGSANVIEHFLIPMPKTEEEAKQALRTHRLVFLFAPFYHEAMKHVAPVRQSLKMRTVFNLLGPLVNPAQPKRQVIGVHDKKDARKMAEALRRMGTEHTVFVTSDDGLDECSISAVTQLIELKHDHIVERIITPEDVGLQRGCLSHICVHSVNESAQLIEHVFANRANKSATNIVLLNAGVTLYVAGVASHIEEGVDMAKRAIETGRAYAYLQRLRGAMYA